MSGFDYGNARLRARKSRLLASRDLDDMTAVNNIEGMISILTKTDYREAVNLALARVSEMDCIGEALHQDMIDTLVSIRGFYTERAGEIVAHVLGYYEVGNIKAILRGLEKNSPPAEIFLGLIPVGKIKGNILRDLASASDPRAAIDLIASMGLPIAQPLLKLRAEFPGVSVPDMELALDRWYFENVKLYHQENRGTNKTLFPAMQLEADLINLLTVFRFAHRLDEHKFRRELLLSEDFTYLLIGPGRLSLSLLEQAALQETVEAAIYIFSGTAYERPLKNGLKAYAQTARLSDLEKHLKRYRRHWMAAQIFKDPLGIGVLLGYLALKTNEIHNLRWILGGIRMGLKPIEIKASLEYPA